MAVAALTRTLDGLRDVFGRGMNLYSDVYKLPADTEEHDRLTLQHRIWKLILGGPGLYPPDVQEMVERLLLPSGAGSSPTPSVLDLGSGSGIWAAEMAAMYPHTKVVGLDLTEPKLQKRIPDNCSFVTADLTKALDGYSNTFDIVHCRCVAGHVYDRAALLRQILKVLKPGGLLLLGDGNMHLFAPDGSRIPLASTSPSPTTPAEGIPGSWVARWLSEVIGHMLSTSLEPEFAGGEYIGHLVRAEPGFDFIEHRPYFSPIRASCEQEQEVARLVGLNMLNFLTASKPILLSCGKPSDLINDWERRAREEILSPPTRWLMKWDLVWATKKESSYS